MIRMLPRTSRDVTYLSSDRALELSGVREGDAGWWIRGSGDWTNERDVEHVLCATERSSVVGFDLVVAAPRPISILLAVGTHEEQCDVVRAHRDAVASAIQYLDERGVVTRLQHGGDVRDEQGRWESVVAFTHGVNRHSEPHLHDHVLVGSRPHDSAHALDSRSLNVHLEAADALYRASLRIDIRERTGRNIWRSFQGVEHVEGVDSGHRTLWPGHHRERGEKHHWSRTDATSAWGRDLEHYEAEFEPQRPSRDPNELDEHVFGGHFEGQLRVTRRDIVTAFANAATFGVRASDVTGMVDELYPTLRTSRGIREEGIGVPQARQIDDVRRHGPRPTKEMDLDAWRQRARSLERSYGDRSR